MHPFNDVSVPSEASERDVDCLQSMEQTIQQFLVISAAYLGLDLSDVNNVDIKSSNLSVRSLCRHAE